MLSMVSWPIKTQPYTSGGITSTPKHLQSTSCSKQNRASLKNLLDKSKLLDSRPPKNSSQNRRTHTQSFRVTKSRGMKTIYRVKTDVTSINWELQKPLIAQIKGMQYTKEQKMKLLQKKTNFRDFSALIDQKRHSLQKDNFKPKSKSLFLRPSEKNYLKIQIKDIVSSIKKENSKKRNQYKLLNMIGSKAPLYKIDGAVPFNHQPFFIRTNTDDLLY